MLWTICVVIQELRPHLAGSKKIQWWQWLFLSSGITFNLRINLIPFIISWMKIDKVQRSDKVASGTEVSPRSVPQHIEVPPNIEAKRIVSGVSIVHSY